MSSHRNVAKCAEKNYFSLHERTDITELVFRVINKIKYFIQTLRNWKKERRTKSANTPPLTTSAKEVLMIKKLIDITQVIKASH